jgi:hypothetical protein
MQVANFAAQDAIAGCWSERALMRERISELQ